MGCDLVLSHLGATIRGSFSTRSRIISNDALPLPRMIPALSVVRWYEPLESSSSTVLRDPRCFDRVAVLTIPLRYITCFTRVTFSLSLKLTADSFSILSNSPTVVDIECIR